jgi:hypothetical protein
VNDVKAEIVTRLACAMIAMSVLIVGGPALAKTGQCLIEVNGKTYLKGPCEISMDGGHGSFSVGAGAHRSKYFAYVNLDEGRAEGFWNGVEAETHAQESLGPLVRDGACWKNRSARICAYK